MVRSFCPYPLKDDKTSKLDIEKIEEILKQIDSNDKDFKYITFSDNSNEPLLDKRIFEITEMAQKLNFKIYFITNGLLFK